MLLERYNLIEKLGAGGFAQIFLAEDLKTNQVCVVKKLLLSKANNWKNIEMFEREANILQQLEHPNIPNYLNYFVIESSNNVEYYLVQEYVKGKTLAQWLEKKRHFSEEEVIFIALQISEILVYLQQFSPPIIHRDIKPENIILTENNQAYLIDFGGVQSQLRVGGGSTFVGTIGYMPPEQTKGKTVAASDIYALGITLIHLLSHLPPSEMEDKNLSLNFHPHVNISKSFSKILEKMIHPILSKRYQNADSLLNCLDNVQEKKETNILSQNLEDINDFNWKFLALGLFLVVFYSFSSLIKIGNIGQQNKNINNYENVKLNNNQTPAFDKELFFNPPSTTQLVGYQKYLSSAYNHKAFAVSTVGTWWAYAGDRLTPEMAIEDAIDMCYRAKGRITAGKCLVVSVDGEKINPSEANNRIKYPNNKNIPTIETEDIEDIIVNQLRTNNQIDVYKAYMKAKKHKAFAISLKGEGDYAANRMTTDIAKREALINCNRYANRWGNKCFVIKVD